MTRRSADDSKEVADEGVGAATAKAPPGTCFVMMPISDVDGYPTGHFGEVYRELIAPAVEAAGYVCSLATTTNAAHLIQLEVVTRVATADLCICDLSTNNPNVLFEYGIRQAFDKPTVLIKDDKTRRIFDVSGFRDITYDHTLRIANILAARAEIQKAIADTVAGRDDEAQVFSLVKLMQLSKAAFPAGEVSPDNARFALLEQKIDGLTQVIAAGQSASRGSYKPTPTVKFGNAAIRFHKSYFEVLSNDGDSALIADSVDLDRSKFYQSLSVTQRKELTTLIDRYCPEFLPF